MSKQAAPRPYSLQRQRKRGRNARCARLVAEYSPAMLGIEVSSSVEASLTATETQNRPRQLDRSFDIFSRPRR